MPATKEQDRLTRLLGWSPFRHLRLRPRLWSSVAVGIATGLLLPQQWVGYPLTRSLVGWNVGALLYLAMTFVLMARSSSDTIRSHAKIQEEGQYTILALVSVATVAVLIAIGAQLAYAKATQGSEKAAHVALAFLTVLTAWTFTQTTFALHYAHEYHRKRGATVSPAFEFPGTDEPDYFDFLYVACIIGTSAQTADVAFSSRRTRRVGLMHCVLAFFFNTTLLALTINVAAALI
jgi:uncharacterized membrane protein